MKYESREISNRNIAARLRENEGVNRRNLQSKAKIIKFRPVPCQQKSALFVSSSFRFAIMLQTEQKPDDFFLLSLVRHRVGFFCHSYSENDLVFNVNVQRAYIHTTFHFILALNSFSLISYKNGGELERDFISYFSFVHVNIYHQTICFYC